MKQLFYAGMTLAGVALFLIAMLLLSGTFSVAETVIDREVITNSQGYVDGQVAALEKAYNEYTRLNVSALESQWCQKPDCDRVELLEGYKLAMDAQVVKMERIVGLIPASEVPTEIKVFLDTQ